MKIMVAGAQCGFGEVVRVAGEVGGYGAANAVRAGIAAT